MFWPQLASAVARWISHGTFTKSSVCPLPEISPSIPRQKADAGTGWGGNAGKR